jgi:hypothetical protein
VVLIRFVVGRAITVPYGVVVLWGSVDRGWGLVGFVEEVLDEQASDVKEFLEECHEE